MNQKRESNHIINKLFFRLLPIQVLIVAMGSINTLVDGAIAGRFIDSTTVGVVGLYYAMVQFLNAIGAVFLGGTAVLCGRYMGAADVNKTKGVFSLNMTSTFIIGAILTVISIVFGGTVADILGATEELKGPLVLYIRGFAVGILPLLLGQQIASFLQLERQNKRNYVAIVAMIICNIATDILFVAVLKWGIMGLALATSASNWIYFLILAQYYLTDKVQITYDRKSIVWGELKEMVKIGIPGAMLIFAIAMRNLAINRILLAHAGNDGLSAQSAFNMICGILLAYCLGNGAVVRMLTSIFVGEENDHSIKSLIKLVYTKGMVLIVALTVIVILLSGTIAAIFFPDRTSNVFGLCKQLIIIYALCLPMILVCTTSANYLQALGHNKYVNILSVFDGFFALVIPAAILAPILGALGVWIANPIGIALTMLLTPLYCSVFWKRKPQGLGEWLFIPKGFGAREEDRLDLTIKGLDDVANSSEVVQGFCKAHGVDERVSYYSALCLEETVGNVVEHGFHKDNKEHDLNANVVYNNGDILLRIKDDCIPFNPEERLKQVTQNPDDPMENLGIRMVHELADEVIYQNLIGLNVLTIKLSGTHAEGKPAASE